MSKRLTGTKTIQRVDEETGELLTIETEKNFLVKVDSERFYMCFFEKMSSFYGIKHISNMKIMVAMCEQAEFNTGIVTMSKRVRAIIGEKTGVSMSNISKNLKRLISIDLIAEINGDYVINPEVFWKGELKKRSELLEVDGLKFNITLVS